METNNKRFRVIVWDCKQKKAILDEQSDCFIGGVLRDMQFKALLAGDGDKYQKKAAIKEMMTLCRQLKRIIRREKGSG